MSTASTGVAGDTSSTPGSLLGCDFTRVEKRCGVYDDHASGFACIPEKHIREVRANAIMARLPMMTQLANRFPAFREASPSDARRFVKAVKSGVVKHSVFVDICSAPNIHDSCPYSARVITPRTVVEFIVRFPGMAHAMIDDKAEELRYDLYWDYSCLRDDFVYAEHIWPNVVEEFRQAKRRLGEHYHCGSFGEYLSIDPAGDFFRNSWSSLKWAFAVIFAARGDLSALPREKGSEAAVAILARIVRSSHHWRSVVGEIEATCKRSIEETTCCTVEQIESLRLHLLGQFGRLTEHFSMGSRFSYQQVRLAEACLRDGLVEQGCNELIRTGEMARFDPATEIIGLRVDPITHRCCERLVSRRCVAAFSDGEVLRADGPAPD